jgi:hypothetical protein
LNIATKGICKDKSGIGVPTHSIQSAYIAPVCDRMASIYMKLCDGRCQGHSNYILISNLFWETRMECVFKFSGREEEVQISQAQLTNDSDFDSGNSQSDQSVSSPSSRSKSG